MTWRRSPRPIGIAIGEERRSWEPETVLAEVQRVWREVVGPAIAAEAMPSSERGGVLTISCSGAVWAQELDLMAMTILASLNSTLRGGRIERLRCVATPFPDRDSRT